MMCFILEIQRNLPVGNCISSESWRIRQFGQKNDGEGTAVGEDIQDEHMLWKQVMYLEIRIVCISGA